MFNTRFKGGKKILSFDGLHINSEKKMFSKNPQIWKSLLGTYFKVTHLEPSSESKSSVLRKEHWSEFEKQQYRSSPTELTDIYLLSASYVPLLGS